MTGRSNTATALGAIAVLLGVILILSGMGPMGEYRDADGFYMSDPFTVDRVSHAIVSSDVDLLRGRYETITEGSVVLGFVRKPDDVRMQALAREPDALFLGIAPTSAVHEYLSGVGHEEVTEWDSDRAAMTDIEYTMHQGSAPPSPPSSEAFWETSTVGPGQLTLDWTIEPGDWTAVIMNADASRGITAELALGAAPSRDIQAMAQTVLAFGAGALLVGGLLLYLGLSDRPQRR